MLLVVKDPSANAGDAGLVPELGRSSGEGNGNPFQYACLENSLDRGAWRATVHETARVGHDYVTHTHTHTHTRHSGSPQALEKRLNISNY